MPHNHRRLATTSAPAAGVVAVLLFGLEQGERGVGEHRVIAPHREQLALPDGGLLVRVADPADDQPGGDLLRLLPGERGVLDLGDLGVGDPAAELVIPDRPGIADRVHLHGDREERPGPVHPVARAAPTASAANDAAPRAEAALPPRSPAAAMTGAPSGVLIVAASAFSPQTSKLLP